MLPWRIVMADATTLNRILLDLYGLHQSDPDWLEKSLAVLTDDCEVVNIPLGATSHGPSGYARFIQAWVAAFPDSTVEITNLFSTDDQGVVEFIGRGTNTGPLLGPVGVIAATGRRAEVRFCNVQRFADGKVSSFHQYFDLMGLLQQLGVPPAMPSSPL
ncbi:ester cyclase [Nonomuraea sp. NPDC049486]|uniref:ester cyclase n=1 Tax=Nonomuraea sp. NPDC049486 TaxID=3155773 RepID=UPI00342B396E